MYISTYTYLHNDKYRVIKEKGEKTKKNNHGP